MFLPHLNVSQGDVAILNNPKTQLVFDNFRFPALRIVVSLQHVALNFFVLVLGEDYQ